MSPKFYINPERRSFSFYSLSALMLIILAALSYKYQTDEISKSEGVDTPSALENNMLVASLAFDDDIDPPPSPNCGSGNTLLWENDIDIDDDDVDVDLLMYRNNNTLHTIYDGNLPSEFDGNVTVDITEAIAWDGYEDRDDSGNQPNEKFKVIFLLNGQLVGSSNWTGSNSSGNDGIATGVESDYWRGGLGTIVLPNGADQIKLVHWSNSTYGMGDGSNANSVVPASVCMSYNGNGGGSSSCDADITSLIFNDLSGNSDVTIQDGQTYHLNNDLPSSFNIEAIANSSTDKVKFTFTGRSDNTENNEPYRLPTDDVALSLTPGTYTVTAEAFDDHGNSCETESATFTITNTFSNPGTEECANRSVSNTVKCSGGDNYGFYLVASGIGSRYSVSGGSFVEYTNGTARYTASLTNTNNSSYKFDIDVIFTGRNTNGANGSPKSNECGNEDTGDWYYYSSASGSLTGKDDFSGAYITISNTGASFQLGKGANVTHNDVTEFGASGWFNAHVQSQPHSGPHLSLTGDSDINIQLSGEACDCFGGSISVHAGSDETICSGSSVTLTATPSGGSGYSYLWSNGKTTQSITVSPSSTKTYGVTVTAGGSCEASDHVKVTVEDCCTGELTGIIFNDLSGNSDVSIQNNGTYDLKDDLPSSFNIEAYAIGHFDNIYFDLSGHGTKKESTSPYRYPTDEVVLNITPGDYTLTVKVRDENDVVCDERTVNFTITHEPDDPGDEICANRSVSNTHRCTSGDNYGFFLDASGIGNNYSVSGASFKEFTNGTARYTASLTNTNNSDYKFDIDVIFTGRNKNGANGSPKSNNCGDENSEAWYYYSSASGFLIGKGDFAGAYITLSNTGPSFQLGKGANATHNDITEFGASGWFNAHLQSQPNSGPHLSLNGDSDINIQLSGTECECFDAISVDAGDDETICDGSSVTLTANPSGASGYSYLWSTGATTQSITVSPSSTKTYGVTVTASGACEGADHVKVTVEDCCTGVLDEVFFNDLSGNNDKPLENNGTYDLNDDLPSSFNIEATASGSFDDILFELSGVGSNDQDIFPYRYPSDDVALNLTPGTYTLTVKVRDSDGATCDQLVVTFTITHEPDDPGDEICANRSVSNTDPCNGGDDYVFYLPASGIGNRYSISGGSFVEFTNGTARYTGTLINTDNSNYKFDIDVIFTGRNTNGNSDSPKGNSCGSEDTEKWYYYSSASGFLIGKDDFAGAYITIEDTDASFQLGKGANVTHDDVSDFGGSGWFNAHLQSQPTSGPHLSISGNSDINIQLSGSECECFDQISVDAGDDETICDGSSVTLTANPSGTSGYSYLWSTGATTQSITVSPSSTKTYGVTVTASGACEGSDHVKVTVEECCTGLLDQIFFNDLSGNNDKNIQNNQTYDLKDDLPSSFNIEATATGNFDNIFFQLSGHGTKVENSSPYRYPSNTTPLNINPGTYTLTVQVRDDNNVVCDERIITFTITHEPDDPGDEICADRSVSNTERCTSGDDYGFFLEVSGIENTYRTSDDKFVEFTNGTARYTAHLTNVDNSDYQFEIDVVFTGRNRNGANGSPKSNNCGTADTDAWYYYSSASGFLVGKGDFTGAYITLSNTGPSFQLGKGANATHNDVTEFGASGWFNANIQSQPTDGPHLNLTGDSDINIQLSGSECECFDEITVELGPDQTICKGNSVTLTADASGGSGYTYKWSTGATTQSITVTPNSTQTYGVTVTASGACTGSDHVKVTVIDPPHISIHLDDNNICEGETATFTANVNNGSGCGTLTWQIKEGDGSFQNVETGNSYTTSSSLDAGSYTVRAVLDCSATGCGDVVSEEKHLTIKKNTDIEISSDKDMICEGETIHFTAVKSGEDCTVKWQLKRKSDSDFHQVGTGMTYNTDTGLEPGVYEVRAKLSCSGGDDEGGDDEDDEEGGDEEDEEEGSDEEEDDEGGDDEGNKCGSNLSEIIEITIVEDPEISISSNGDKICEGGVVTFTAHTSGGFNCSDVQWQLKIGSGSFTNVATGDSYSTSASLIAGNYTIRAKYNCSGAGCDNATSNEEHLLIVPDPQVNISTDGDEICEGGQVTFTAVTSGGFNCDDVQWQLKSGNGSFENVATGDTYTTPTSLTEGSYQVKAIYSCQGIACDDASSNIVDLEILPAPEVTISAPADKICVGGSVTFTAVTSGGTDCNDVQWQLKSGNGSFTNVATGDTYDASGLGEGDYTIRAIYTCSGSDCGDATSNELNLEVLPDPEVTISAPSDKICVGGDVTFTAQTSGGFGCDDVQWQLKTGNGSFVNVATGSTYDASGLDEGDYQIKAILSCSG
ncbi:MAG: hypothetical protein AAFO07_13370, partial [Bacteroidota bacterium]